MHRALCHLRLRPLILLVVLAAAFVPSACRGTQRTFGIQPHTLRALWVTRFDYATRDDVLRIVDDAANANFNTILFQVRGNATASYDSALEPWSELLGGSDPGFDPLAVAVEAAHRRGVDLHAWVNVVPAWWGSTPPVDPKQVYNARPEWLWYDQEGRQQPLSERFYVSLNPCLPEVRKYIAEVCEDLVARYPVTGLHLDYLRFPNEPPASPRGADYPRDERTLALFRAETDTTPEQSPEAWDRWRSDQVTLLLEEIRYRARQARPNLVLSAAVGPDPERALEHFQDVRAWAERGLLDYFFPMNYAQDRATFMERVETWRDIADKREVVMGIRVHDEAPEELGAKIDLARGVFRGYAIFAYGLLWDSAHDQLEAQSEAARFERRERRKRLLPMIQ